MSLRTLLSLFPFALIPTLALAEPPDASVFETTTWATTPQVKDPVSISFDNRGRLYVVETERRTTVDVDIRSHKPWIKEDLANQNIGDLRAFVRRKFAPKHSESNQKWPADYNNDGSHDWHDLRTISDSIRLLEDTDGSGTADKSTVFATGFQDEITGVAEGVLWHNDDVFFTIFPHVWRLRDTDGDDQADYREAMHTGFGVHAAFDGHDIHGLTVGPDGLLYFSVGDNGTSVNSNPRVHYPNQGVILRCRFDGSGLEVFAQGLRNPQEIAFDDYGNLFTVDNDGDMRGESERFVYLVEGGDSGWRLNWQFRTAGWSKYTGQPHYNPWIDERMWVPQEPGQPAYLLPPLSNYSIGPGGFKHNPGIGLNDAYRGFFFLVQFPAQVVSAFRVQPKGAAFEMVDEHAFHQGKMISSVHFGDDGALYMADWVGKWKPNGEGSILKVDDPSETGTDRRKELQSLLRADWKNLSVEQLLGHLAYPDQRVRQRAQFALVARNQGEVLMAQAENPKANQLARVHALWGLGQLGCRNVHNSIDRLPFHDPDTEIQAQTAQLVGKLGFDFRDTTFEQEIEPVLISLLKSPSARVRFHAAISLGKVGSKQCFEPLVTMLDENNGQDAYLRHAGAMGISPQVGPTGRLISHPSREVRLAAVVALRRRYHVMENVRWDNANVAIAIAQFLQDPEPEVVIEAARAIHDDFSIQPALIALASTTTIPANEGFIRRMLNANLRVGQTNNAARLASFALNTTQPSALRLEAALCLAEWNALPYLDRVTSRVRTLGKRDSDLGKQTLESAWPQLIATADPALLRGLTQLADKVNLPMEESLLVQMTRDEHCSVPVRVETLNLLAKRNSTQLMTCLQYALASAHPELRNAARSHLADNSADEFYQRVGNDLVNATLSERQALLALLGKSKDARALPYLTMAMQDLLNDSLAQDIRLDVLEAVRAQPSLKPQVEAYDSALDRTDPLAGYRVALHGGQASRGQELITEHVSAQCLRCHNLEGDAKQLGPNLQHIGSRLNTEQLLESLVHPNAKIAEGYQMVTLTVTGEASPIAGTIASETEEALVITQISGEPSRVTKSKITDQQRINISSMPSMAGVLSLKELRDVVAYLSSLKLDLRQ